MSWVDRFRRIFKARRSPELDALEPFARGRKGVEGFVEPETATNPVTLLLVDRDGDHVRAPVRAAEEAFRFCDRLGIPVYDAQVIGYPRRMRDFERGRRDRGETIDEQFAEIERRLKERDDPPET